MREIIKEGIKILLQLSSLVIFIFIMTIWMFYDEQFDTIEVKDLIMLSLLIIVGFMPDDIKEKNDKEKSNKNRTY